MNGMRHWLNRFVGKRASAARLLAAALAIGQAGPQLALAADPAANSANGLGTVVAMPTKADIAAVAQSNNAFAVDLYARLAATEGNVFFSPASVETALGMTLAGARGHTREQMARVLHLSLADEQLHPALAAMLGEIQRSAAANNEVLAANALWVERDYPLQADFTRVCRDSYRAQLTPLGFADRDAACRAINGWVAEKTKNKIRDLLVPEQVPAATRLILTNAVYFQGRWAYPFDKSLTAQGPFHVSSAKTVQTSLMRQGGRFHYYEQDDVQIIELPYAGQRLSLVVLLPRDRAGLSQIESKLNADKLDGWLDKLVPQQVELTLPRMRLDAKARLSSALVGLGMAEAFSPAADFTGISSRGDLQLAQVFHQAYLAVDEEGTVAAAATAVAAAEKSLVAPTPKIFRADHPFILLIRDRDRDAILFLGRIANPTP